MIHFNYILFSGSAQKFYVGETEDLVARLIKHNRKQVKSTKHGVPWAMIWSVEVPDRSTARQLEKKIKSRGAKRYLNDIGFNDQI